MNWYVIRGFTTKRLAVLAAAFAVGTLALVTQGRLYADAGTWTTGELPVLSVSKTSTTFDHGLKTCVRTGYFYFSYGTNPSSEGSLLSAGGCQTTNQSGDFYNSGNNETADNFDFISPGTSLAFRVLRPGGRVSGVTPIPDGPGFIWKEPSTRWGSPAAPHFFSDFRSAGSFGQYSYGSNIVPWELAFEINKTGSVLTDSAGSKLYMHAYAFSQNGQWMVMEVDGLGLVRVNTETLQTLLFDTVHFSYNYGSAQMTLAISNDGNAVIRSGQSAGDTTVYDLSGCQGGAFTVGADNSLATAGCQKRDVQQSLIAQLDKYQYMYSMHFGNDGKNIAAIAVSTGLNGIPLYNTVHYAVAGYVPPAAGYIALGDSFSSGEGEYDYISGTNSGDNSCHQSYLSYPYLAAAALDISNFHSVACSGAASGDYFVKQRGQNRVESPLGDWLPGYRPQGDYFELTSDTSVVTISMIGNDIGFGDILKRCLMVADTCYHYKEDRQSIADMVYGKFKTLVGLYKQIKMDSGSPDSVKVYVLGYPQIAGTNDTCGANVWFNQEERQMAQGLISYLNAVIKAATVNAGVQYIDVEHAFDGHKLCETEPFAVNGFSLDKKVVHSILGLGAAANSSYHPDPLGHRLMSQALLLQSDNFTKPMPASSLVNVPYAGSAEYDAFVNSAPSGGTFTRLVYIGDSETSAVVRGSFIPIDVNLASTAGQHLYQVWFNSTPVYAGTLTSDENGRIVGNVPVPSNLEPGYHTIHIYGKNIANQDIDMYETVYVAASEADFNGDGITNDQDPCLIMPASGVDQDRDGMDDACDGNIESAPADRTPPKVTGAADRIPDYGDWYNHDVTINWLALDPDPSSGAPTQPDPTVADQDGDVTYTSGQSCDPAGNCATGSVRLKLDMAVPSITFGIDPAPNLMGWNRSGVSVIFSCGDATSGVASCTAPAAVSGDGGHIATGTATDNAGNSASVNAVVAIDTAKPSIGTSLAPKPNVNGWNNSSVTLTTTCADSLSGVATCSDPVTITSEGSQQPASTSSDNAGNLASVTTSVRIDKTPPIIDGFDWMNNPKATTGLAMLTLHASDNLSGIAGAEYFVGDSDPGVGNGVTMPQTSGGYVATLGTDLAMGVYKINMRIEDLAGNWSMPTSDYLVVYNPFSTRITGHRFVSPSLASGDNLPWLETGTQAKFALSVGYDARGDMLPNNAFQFEYHIGSQCGNPSKAQGCHTFELDATTVDWFTVQSPGGSTGLFQGDALLGIDGNTQQVKFVATGVDGEIYGGTEPDKLRLLIYQHGDNPSSAIPMYQINDDVERGSIHIKA